MTDPLPTLQAARERAIDTLCRAFAEDALSMGELERRLAKAREARTREELRTLLADVRRTGASPVEAGKVGAGKVEERRASGTRPDTAREPGGSDEIRQGSHLAFAIMGGTRRAGRWAPPGNMLAVAIMGGVELDFRDAVLTPGVTEINVFAFWGGVEITVPPGVHVDTHGLAILGGFDQTTEVESNPPPGAPTIRVNGAAIMAGVEVKVRAPGEKKRRRSMGAGEEQKWIEGSGGNTQWWNRGDG